MQRCNICGTKTERKEFKTFGYNWCPKCKEEVTVTTTKTENIHYCFSDITKKDRVLK